LKFHHGSVHYPWWWMTRSSLGCCSCNRLYLLLFYVINYNDVISAAASYESVESVRFTNFSTDCGKNNRLSNRSWLKTFWKTLVAYIRTEAALCGLIESVASATTDAAPTRKRADRILTRLTLNARVLIQRTLVYVYVTRTPAHVPLTSLDRRPRTCLCVWRHAVQNTRRAGRKKRKPPTFVRVFATCWPISENCFNGTFSDKVRIKYVPPYLNSVATLPCRIQM